MSKLRKSARGRDCTAQIMGVCNYNPDTVVLAHLRMSGDGMGRKPSDTRAAYLCSACHDVVDNRTPYSRLSPNDILLEFALAVFRTQDIMLEEGLIK